MTAHSLVQSRCLMVVKCGHKDTTQGRDVGVGTCCVGVTWQDCLRSKGYCSVFHCLTLLTQRGHMGSGVLEMCPSLLMAYEPYVCNATHLTASVCAPHCR